MGDVICATANFTVDSHCTVSCLADGQDQLCTKTARHITRGVFHAVKTQDNACNTLDPSVALDVMCERVWCIVHARALQWITTARTRGSVSLVRLGLCGVIARPHAHRRVRPVDQRSQGVARGVILERSRGCHVQYQRGAFHQDCVVMHPLVVLSMQQ